MPSIFLWLGLISRSSDARAEAKTLSWLGILAPSGFHTGLYSANNQKSPGPSLDVLIR